MRFATYLSPDYACRLRARRAALWLVVAATFAVLVPAAASGAPPPTWLPPSLLSEPGGLQYTTPHVAVDPRGDAATIWTQDGVEVSLRPAGGAWSAPVRLSEPTTLAVPGEHAHIALDGRGDAVATWVLSEQLPGKSLLYAATRPAGGEWSTPVLLSQSCPLGGGELGPDLAVGENGDAIVGWDCLVGSFEAVPEIAFRPAGGSWQAPESPAQGARGDETRVAIDAHGNATAAWRGGAPVTVRASYRPAGGSWSTPVQLSTLDGLEIQLAADGLGGVEALWRQNELQGESVISAYESPGGVWNPATDVAPRGDGPEGSYTLRVATAANGDATAVWEHSHTMDASSRPAGGSWELPIAVSETAYTDTPTVAMDASGDAVATFGSRDEHIDSAFKPDGGPWQSAVAIAPSSVTSTSDVALTPRGRAVAAWLAGEVGGSIFGPDTVQAALSKPPIERAEYKNWTVSGSIADKKLGQAITLPAGSTFVGEGELEPETGTGSVSGHVSIPPFTTAIKLLGHLQLHLGMTATQVGPIEGALAASATVTGDETLTMPLELNLGVTSFTLLGLTVPVACATTEGVVLALSDTLAPEALLSTGWSFDGTTSLPSFKCHGWLGSAPAALLNALVSGPENPFSITVSAPSS